MTIPVAPSSAVLPGLTTRLAVQAVVAAARLLARRPPRRLRQVLTVVASGARPATYAEAAQARDTVLAVSVRCCGPRACLPRSIAVALLCRLRGTWPTWCAGVVAVPPFTAHAWVEVDGRPVDETVEAGYLGRLIVVGVES
jgi:hypothetical protein